MKKVSFPAICGMLMFFLNLILSYFSASDLKTLSHVNIPHYANSYNEILNRIFYLPHGTISNEPLVFVFALCLFVFFLSLFFVKLNNAGRLIGYMNKKSFFLFLLSYFLIGSLFFSAHYLFSKILRDKGTVALVSNVKTLINNRDEVGKVHVRKCINGKLVTVFETKKEHSFSKQGFSCFRESDLSDLLGFTDSFNLYAFTFSSPIDYFATVYLSMLLGDKDQPPTGHLSPYRHDFLWITTDPDRAVGLQAGKDALGLFGSTGRVQWGDAGGTFAGFTITEGVGGSTEKIWVEDPNNPGLWCPVQGVVPFNDGVKEGTDPCVAYCNRQHEWFHYNDDTCKHLFAPDGSEIYLQEQVDVRQ